MEEQNNIEPSIDEEEQLEQIDVASELSTELLIETRGDDIEDEVEEAPITKDKPSLVINVHSWATPILGLVMLVIGLLGGYFGRPLITPADTEEVTIQNTQNQPSNTQGPSMSSEQRSELSEAVISRTRHFKGNPNAPVTLIEFGDFQ